MDNRNIFKRYEIKYLLNPAQLTHLRRAITAHMRPDAYGRSTIRNVYFDTPDHRLIRHSLEKPVYKEKLRLRSYRQTNSADAVFVELKKKYKGIVYKRRLSMPEDAAMCWLCHGGAPPVSSQISREITYFRDFYPDLQPMMFVSYDRQAFFDRENGDFRVTFDENILCRQTDLRLSQPVWGEAILPPEMVLMELKTPGGIPLWMTHALTEAKAYKTSFSKYGTAYTHTLPLCAL